ncbi:proteoglycan 4 isoform X2 [Wyeomyia smithii]|uniref:proteoglycan 4 isoform X2 n=1 Tax=Wyeomyia smithii TaxID=174621 RepID=UPI002467BD1E|nr:proteoglycan 4 isoform X2 [Wyeomyia smithii]
MMPASNSEGTAGGTGGSSKSDTSSRAAPIKNPLLSMQVTGLTLDDFSHNALLLPAAPVPTPTVIHDAPPPLLEISREAETTDIKKPVIFSPLQPGVVPDLQDSDSFSEIDLHSTTDSLNNAPSSATEYNPLQDLEESEAKNQESNSYLQQTSAITAQFAAQLPTVASTVFSTFSRVIKGSSPVPQQQPISQPVQPSPIPHASYDYTQSNFGSNSESGTDYQQPLPPPPTFFNPEAIGSTGPANSSVAAPTGANTYRLGGNKKKTYAHIPGLSSTVPPPATVTDLQNQEIKTFISPQETQSGPFPTQPAQEQAKSGFSFFEKIPNLLEKIPKSAFGPLPPSTIAPSSSNYFSLQSSTPEVPSFEQPPAPPQTANFAPPPRIDNVNTPLQSAYLPLNPPTFQSENLPPPPTFFAPAEIPAVPSLPQNQPSKNPYSSNRLSRGVGLYKNPIASPVPTAPVTFLPNNEPPKVTSPAAYFQHSTHQPPVSVSTEQSQPSPPVQFYNPVGPIHKPSPTPPRSSEPITAVDAAIANSRPQSSLSESLSRKANLFAPFEEDPRPEAKTILDSRSKSSENVLSPPPRPNSNLSEPALFSDGQPISLFKPDIVEIKQSLAQTFSHFNPSGVTIPEGTKQANNQWIPPPVVPQQSVATVSAVNFFDPVQSSNQPPSTLPPPPSIGTVGSKPYNLQKTRRSAYTVPPSLATTAPVATPAQVSQLFFESAAPVVPPEHQAAFFNPQQLPTAPTSYFNPIASSQQIADRNANPIEQPIPQKPFSLFESPITQKDSNSNQPSQQVPPATVNFFSNNPAPADVLNANFSTLQLSQNKPSLSNPSDFFNIPAPSEPTVTATGQTQSQFFNFFGQPPLQTALPYTPVLESADHRPPLASALFGADRDQVDTATNTGEQPSSVENNEQPIQLIEPSGEEIEEEEDSSDSAANRARAINESQLDDRYDDPVEQERIGNAPEPIFSSDNLFEFKKSAFEDDTYSKDVLIDANSSSMAAMTATAAAATGGGTSAAAVDSSMASISETTNVAYRPVYRHWFFKREIESKCIWSPFSMSDSLALEDALPTVDRENDAGPVVIHVDGGRHDVLVKERRMSPVYWKGASQEVRRCSWFYKNVDSRFVPYDEEVADLLEREYKDAATSGEWHRRVTIPNGETVVFHGPSVIVHFLQTQNPDSWGTNSPVPPTTNRPRVVKRGVDEFNIEDGEPEKVDHLLFMVHGIGEACDLRFRPVEEVVDEFRSISAQLVQSHYRSSFDRGDIGRVEVLPISWHNDLHSEESGVDKKLKAITLESIPKLRNFTNDTLLDVLFYTSPMFCQSIIDAVGKSLNRLYSLFLQRNPNFNGGVSLAGHSLGSLILFDLLCHQKGQPMETENSENPDGDRVPALHRIHPSHRPLSRKCSQQINYEVGPAGTGQPYIAYPQLLFNPKKFFALGSPIGMFVTVRGIDALGLDFRLPTCEGFFNIFHPYDPVAYRIEALVNTELSNLRPVLIPHHKGRKRMHLELKETMVRVGTDLKQKVLDTFRNTLDAVYSMTSLNRNDHKAIEHEVDKVIEDQLKFETCSSATTVSSGDLETGDTDLPLGQLNQSRRIDYVLQEAPLEFFNEYLFALTSHVCYWESEDTMLFLMKEIYSSMGVESDSQIPQQSMTIERPISSPTPSNSSHSNYNLFPHAQPPPSVSNR